MLRRLEAMLGGGASGRLGLPRVAPGRELTVVVDFSSPNIAKEMHVVSPTVHCVLRPDRASCLAPPFAIHACRATCDPLSSETASPGRLSSWATAC